MLALLIVPLLFGSPQESAQEDSSPTTNLESLRNRVHDMRKDLLLSGKQVREAESEAIDFYTGKVEAIDQRVDGIEADLVEKRAAYDLALERVLSTRDPAANRSAAVDAAQARRRVAALAVASFRSTSSSRAT